MGKGAAGVSKVWRLLGHAGTVAWLWSVGGGAVSGVVLRAFTNLSLPWVIVLAFGSGLLILASVLTRRQTQLDPSPPIAAPEAPTETSSDEVPSGWTGRDVPVKPDYVAGHEILDVTPQYLTKFYVDNTSYQAEQLVRPFIGQRIQVTGTFFDLASLREGTEFGVRFERADLAAYANPLVTTRFGPEWEGPLTVLKRGDEIAVVGVIEAVWAHGIHLEHCELVR